MVKLEIFSVRDSKAELFITPFHAPTIAAGLRMFESAVNTVDGQFFQHADDYTLFHIGTFSQDSGILVPLATPVSLGLASTLIRSAIQGD